MKRSLAVLTAIAVTFLVGPASAATGLTSTPVNLRIGPGSTYAALTVVPAGQSVAVIGCLASATWCDVVWHNYRGWVAADYIVHPGTALSVVVYDANMPKVAPWVDARRDARVDYRVEKRMDRRWDRWTAN